MVYEFGARLLQLRKAKNLTQQALADRAKALDPRPAIRVACSIVGFIRCLFCEHFSFC